ncbi:site-specific integrase [Paenibacillus periandrae]|uniref:site-specific integrase n=1 Tax=Paenibacillus periandrae TaxID=1761741 RepID=UPI001F09931B|nr:site-specific integrase [Paenibacillus periandrae]
MAKKKSIDSQVLSSIHAIDLASDEREDSFEARKAFYEMRFDKEFQGDSIGKRAFKEQGNTKGLIWSHEGVKQAVSIGKQFANYCKETYGISHLSEITPTMAISWLDEKKFEGCAASTLKGYNYVLDKLSSGIESKYGTDGFYSKEVAKYDAGKYEFTSRFWTNEEVVSIRDYFLEKGEMKHALACDLMLNCGLRGCEIDQIKPDMINLQAGLLEGVIGKGGRVDDIDISRQIDFFTNIKENFEGNKPLLPNFKIDTLGSAIYRASKKLGLEQHKSLHEFRKAYAQTSMLEMFEERGLTQEYLDSELYAKETLTYQDLKDFKEQHPALYEVCNSVIKNLKHGSDRFSLMRTYLFNK